MPTPGEVPENLKPHLFSSTNQPANRGRKPSVLTMINRLTGEEFKINLNRQKKFELIEAMLERTEEELIEIKDNDQIPIFIRMLANSILRDAESRNYSTVEMIFDRVFGRPKQAVDNNVSGEIEFTVNYDKPRATSGDQN